MKRLIVALVLALAICTGCLTEDKGAGTNVNSGIQSQQIQWNPND